MYLQHQGALHDAAANAEQPCEEAGEEEERRCETGLGVLQQQTTIPKHSNPFHLPAKKPAKKHTAGYSSVLRSFHSTSPSCVDVMRKDKG
jgi:hypothetical protein